MATIDGIIQEQIKETEILMRFAGGQVRRFLNPLIDQIQVLSNGISYYLPPELSDRMQLVMTNSVDTSAYQGSVNAAVESVAALEETILESYTSKFGAIPNQATGSLNAARQDAEIRIRENLSSDNVLDNLSAMSTSGEAVVDRIFTLVGQQRSTNEDIKEITGQMIHSAFQKYGQNKVATPLQIYARNAMEALNEAYDNISDFYLYQGPDDEVTREFCQEYANGVYHRREIENWPNDWAHNWEGMIDGTDSSNIFALGGGYNCRHVFVPMSFQDVDESDIARAMTSGLIR